MKWLDTVSLCVIGALLLYLLGFLVWRTVNTLRKRKDDQQQLELDTQPSAREERVVRVLTKSIRTVQWGDEDKQQVREGLFVTFADAAGRQETYEVQQEQYDRLEENDIGILCLEDDAFCDFKKRNG